MIISKTFCPLPWIHLATRPNGDVRVCCTANASGAGLEDDKVAGVVKDGDTNLNLKDYTIEQIWNSGFMRNTRLQMINGEIPESCTKCFNEESNNIVSKRQWETDVWQQRLDLNEILNRTQPDGSLPVNIPYFDLRLGNMCQLKCIMCSPHDSSSWIKEWKIQFPKYTNALLVEDQKWDSHLHDYAWYQKSEFLNSVKDQASYIKELYFAGGEPLIIPEHYKILEFMIETGAAKDCVLRYNSNGVELPEKLFDLWANFKQVTFNFSIDALGEKNDYIRYPSKWNSIERNLHRLDNTPDNIIVNIACAVQALNVLYLDELADWKLSQNFKKIHYGPNSNGVFGTHLVYLPTYLNVRVLPIEVKQAAAKRLAEFANSIQVDKFANGTFGRQRWLGLISYMMAEDWSSKLPALREYLEICDKQRNTDFKVTFPELAL